MKGLVYPLGETTKMYRELNSSYLPTNTVKINVRDQSSCAFHSLLMSICEEYQDARDEMSRKKISDSFKKELKSHLLSPSTMTESAIIDRFSEAHERSNMRDRYRLKMSGDLFKIRIVKTGDPDYTSNRVSYLLFPKNMIPELKPTSKIFELLSLEVLTKMIDQRFLLGLYSEKVMEMERVLSSDTNYQMEEDVERLREMMAFHINKSNSLVPGNLIKLIDDDFCENQDLLIRLFSETLKFNVFFCRAWNTEVSVIKEFRISKSYPSIVIFKIDGKISITGMNAGIVYESGGILTEKGVKTILDPKVDAKVIQVLREIRTTEVDGFYLEKYHTYLNSMGEEEVQEEEVELEVEEASSEDEETEEVQEEEVENLREEDPIDVNVEIPSFIRGYSDIDLKTLLKTFTSSDGESMDRRGMEIMYSNYLRGQIGDVTSRMGADFV
jgi:DNA-binding transcriptional MerR regulator